MTLRLTEILVGSVGAPDNRVEYKPQFCGTSAVPQTPERYGEAVKGSDLQARVAPRRGLVRADEWERAWVGESLSKCFGTAP